MKNKKTIIIIISVVVVAIIGITAFILFNNKNKLSISEKKWVNDHQTSLVDIHILNDVNTFGINGKGVFFDYTSGLVEEFGIAVNPVTYAYGAYTSDVTFAVGNTIQPTDIVFYADHYIVVSKSDTIFTSLSDLSGKEIGILNTDLSYVSSYLDNSMITFTQLDNVTSLIAFLDNKDYIIVPMNLYLDDILNKNYYIAYHFSDIKQYYYLSVGSDKTFASILNKYYNIWSSKFSDSYYTNLFNVYSDSLNLTDVQIHELTDKVYNYAVVDNRPYENVNSGNYGGINNIYLSGFKKLTGVEFNTIKYNDYTKVNKAIAKNKINLYFNNYNLENNFVRMDTLYNIEYDVIAKNDRELTINSLKSLNGKNIYVLDGSRLYDYFTTLNIATVKKYKKISDIQGLINDGEIVIIDSTNYDLYANTKIKNALSRYHGNTRTVYAFMSNCGEVFNKLFMNYIRTIDKDTARVTGTNDYIKAYNKGNLLGGLISYSLYIVLGGAIISYLLYRYNKRTKLVKKIKKEDKMKYVDMLTSLKNRNYLNESIEKWDQNNIYPQTVMIIDLNNVKYINDTYGHNEGDKQIKACANILIKTQLDNTEIIRTDGNEFLVYLIGYEEKQIGSYIRKLSKEFENLPYDYGAAVGYSVINDDLKLLDDAINEATLDMRTNKDKEE